jgi:hypothetical protein
MARYDDQPIEPQNVHSSRPCLRSVAFVTLALCGCAAADDGAADRLWSPERIDTIATAATEVIGRVADIIVASDGKLWIADPLNHHLVILDPATGEVTTTGREGDGPGELRDPQALAAVPGGVLVLEPQAGRLTRFGLNGEFLGSLATNGGLMVPISLFADSTAAAPTLGRQGALLAMIALASGQRTLIGDPIAPPPQVMSISGIRNQELRREFPVEFRNNILPVLDGGDVWIVSQYTGAILRLSATGDTLLATRLSSDLVLAAHGFHFDALASRANGIVVPAVATHAETVGGELWIASVTGEGSTITRLDRTTGAERGRILLATHVGPFTVSLAGGVLFVASVDDVVVLRIPIRDDISRGLTRR